VTRWEVEASSSDAWGNGTTYAVVKVKDDRTREGRARWARLSCIDARVIASELNAAWDEGYDQGRADLAVMWTTPLGD
jgi:hypothetical protein